MKRIFLIILDSLGIGEAPDAEKFGDEGANTLRSVYNTGILNVPNLEKLGLGNIDGIDFIKKTDSPLAAFGRLKELSTGKDTTIGHWEIAGIISENPLRTYPNGFPKEITDAFTKATGKKILCNKPYSGTEVIKDYGAIHENSGDLIVYTSADSVFQIAAHEETVPPEKLYEICRIARSILVGEHSVAEHDLPCRGGGIHLFLRHAFGNRHQHIQRTILANIQLSANHLLSILHFFRNRFFIRFIDIQHGRSQILLCIHVDHLVILAHGTDGVIYDISISIDEICHRYGICLITF